TDADLAISFPDNIPSDNFAEAFSAKNIRVLRLEEAGSSKESIYGAVIANLRKIGITTRAKVDAYLIQLHTMGIFDKTTIQQIPESLERIGFFVDSGATKTTHATGTHSLGVGPSEIGVMLDQQIIEYVNQGILHDPMKRLQLLKDLPYNIQKAIFGSGKTSSRETVEEFQKHSKLYFSYSKEKVANSLFCYAMASLEKEADLVFLLVRTPPLFFTEIKDISSSLWDLIKRDDALREMMVMNFFMEWENLGYHQLRFIWGNQQESVRSIALHPLRKGKKNRTITFISIESVLPHPQFQAALLGSERECQVRGEQSLFDALCAGKIPLNELSTDKGGMTYAMVEMAKSVDARFKGVAHTLLRTVHDHAQGNVLPKIISSIQQARGMGEEWYRLGQTIIHKHNFFPKLDTLVNPCGVSDPLRDR
ncbi:MAG TPA: hypothetical protein VN457_02535, partial [Chlamydiales bacterium]|nr:hypothetical protein [Chlamydiales bacterium]